MDVLVFLGSVRNSTPPKPARLGARVARHCVLELESAGHTVTLIDPLDTANCESGIFKPQFAYAAGKAPASLDKLAAQIKRADAYVMVSPEYNHSMSPALADLLNHFGSSLFSYKPSLIVTYSAGQWGGARAAVSMRAFLSELGCLPVSAMVHIPKAQEVFAPDGRFLEGQDAASWEGFIGRGFSQLAWWAEATRLHRAQQNPEAMAAPFKTAPSQRNAGKTTLK
ncbi:MAG TPA: NADPH-dependent oxidoreductase [Rhodobacteraceae bacterium]|nr:NADPH-dependent oxidoreductase [Paracoccaceae bacterium]